MSAKTWALLLASALVCDHLVTRLLPGTGFHQAKGTGPSRFTAPRDYSTKVMVHPTAWAILDLRPVALISPGAKPWPMELAVSRELPHATRATPGLCT